MKRIGTILSWTALGALAGFAILSMKLTLMMLVPMIAAYGAVPPEVIELVALGAGAGMLIGLTKAGVRIYLK